MSGDGGVRVWNPDLIQEGTWHHLTVTLSRALLKNSTVNLYDVCYRTCRVGA